MKSRKKTSGTRVSRAGDSKRPKAASSRRIRSRPVKARSANRPKRPAKRPPKRAVADVDAQARGLFADLQIKPSSTGCAALLAIAAVDNDKLKVSWARVDRITPTRALKSKTAAKGLPAAQRIRLAQVMDAAASPHRLAILLKLLDGPATYRMLQKTTGLKVGPLYHHVNRLRSEGLIGPRERDLYQLTIGGRNLVIALMAAMSLVSGRRVVM